MAKSDKMPAKKPMNKHESAGGHVPGSKTTTAETASIFAPGGHREILAKVDPRITAAVSSFADRITESAIVGKDFEARARIERAVELIVIPGLVEATTIAEQIADPRYVGDGDKDGYVQETEGALNHIDEQAEVCADLRGQLFLYGSPKITRLYRSAGANLDSAPSAKTRSGYRLANTNRRASIRESIRNRNQSSASHLPRFVNYVGTHFDSASPTTESCAANSAEIEGAGGLPSLNMRDGGISAWYERMGNRFFAFDDEVALQGGESTTFDLCLDTNSSRLVAGLRGGYSEMDPHKDLATNIELLAQHSQVLTTDQILERFSRDIDVHAMDLGVSEPIDIFDYTAYINHLIAIGTIATKISDHEEQKGFTWIPPRLLKDQATGQRINHDAVKSFARKLIGNAVTRKITGLGSGDLNPLKYHFETMLRVGPIGADFNVRTVALIQGTQGGELRRQDVESAKTLSNVLRRNLDNLGYGSDQTARVIRITEVIDPRGKSEKVVAAEMDVARSTVERNLEIISPVFEVGIRNGSVLLFGTIHDRQTRRPVDIVTI